MNDPVESRPGALPLSVPPSRGEASCLGPLLATLTGLGLVGLAGVAQLLAWAGGALGLESFDPTLLQALLSLGPLALLAWLWPASPSRAAFRAWLLAGGYLLLLWPSRWIDSAHSQTLLLAQLGLSLLYLAGLALLRSRSPQPERAQAGSGRWLTLAAAGVMAWPWLAQGALGSPLDTLLALALGLVAGLIAARILALTWRPVMALHSQARGWAIFSGGLVAGVTLLLIASGLSFSGVQLLLMLALPGLGWAGLALGTSPPVSENGPSRLDTRPAALLFGLSLAAILALVDSDILLLEALDPGLADLFLAGAMAGLLAWLLAGVALLGRAMGGRRLVWAAPLGLVIWLGGAALYALTGQPGFYGDRLFVILTEQADISAAAGMTDLTARRAFVFDSLVEQAEQSQAGLRQLFDRVGLAYRPYYLVNAIEVEGGLLTRLLLLTRPEVARVLPSPVMRPLADPPEPASGSEPAPGQPPWNLTNIGAERVWQEFGVRGAGIVIGQSDSGAQRDHPELQPTYRGRESGHDYHWLDPWSGSPAPFDIGGHGTHTLGTIVGQSVGVAPEAEWIACANLQRNLGNPALYLDCMQFMLAPYPRQGDAFRDGDPGRAADVLNNSWGCPEEHEGCDPTSLQPAVRALRAAGIFVVASAGNSGPACGSITDPIAIYDEAFSVGAVDQANNLAVFSSVGPVSSDGSGRLKPDILAPGAQVLSAFPGSSYTKLDGTSMAGPHLTGVVALMWSANPALRGDIERTEQILRETATPFEGTIGSPDLEAALGQLVDPETAEQLADNVEPEQVAPPVEGSCLAQTDLSQIPNPVAGYGIVNAYEAVKQALAERAARVGPDSVGAGEVVFRVGSSPPSIPAKGGEVSWFSAQGGEANGFSPQRGELEGGFPAAQLAPDIASYQMEVELEPAAKTVSGRERISYTNPSPDTLGEVWLHLYLKAFSRADTVWMQESGGQHRGQLLDPAARGDINLTQLTLADGTDLLATATFSDTLMRVPLPEPLPPGQTLVLEATWTSQLPRVFARTGYGGRDDTFFMVGQWYPKMAVYDRGAWDTVPWHTNSEFFHDFGTYEVSITLPEEYVVAGVGQPAGEQSAGDGLKTVHFSAAGVTDFAFAASPDFQIAQTPAGDSEVMLYYLPEHANRVDEYLTIGRGALAAFSAWFGPYPHPRLTIVDVPANAEGAGGMEYPTLITGGAQGFPVWSGVLAIIAAHEIGHQWWPMQTATHEGREPWLDEGLTEYSGMRYLAEAGRGAGIGPFFLRAETLERLSTSRALDLSADLPAWEYAEADYAGAVYGKPAAGLWTLERVVGTGRFHQALADYLAAWRFKHPTAADFRASLEQSLAGEDLAWFFDDYIAGTGQIDYAVGSFAAGEVEIRREGSVRVPVEVEVTLAGGQRSLTVWDGQAESTRLTFDPADPVVAVQLDPAGKLVAEIDRSDNAASRHLQTGPAATIGGRLSFWQQALLTLLGLFA